MIGKRPIANVRSGLCASPGAFVLGGSYYDRIAPLASRSAPAPCRASVCQMRLSACKAQIVVGIVRRGGLDVLASVWTAVKKRPHPIS